MKRFFYHLFFLFLLANCTSTQHTKANEPINLKIVDEWAYYLKIAERPNYLIFNAGLSIKNGEHYLNDISLIKSIHIINANHEEKSLSIDRKQEIIQAEFWSLTWEGYDIKKDYRMWYYFNFDDPGSGEYQFVVTDINHKKVIKTNSFHKKNEDPLNGFPKIKSFNKKLNTLYWKSVKGAVGYKVYVYRGEFFRWRDLIYESKVEITKENFEFPKSIHFDKGKKYSFKVDSMDKSKGNPNYVHRSLIYKYTH